MKKAKVLISYYSGESGFTVHRVYLEPHFNQAEKDLDMCKELSFSKDIKLEECEVYEPNIPE